MSVFSATFSFVAARRAEHAIIWPSVPKEVEIAGAWMNEGACFPIAKTMKSEFSSSLEFLEITNYLNSIEGKEGLIDNHCIAQMPRYVLIY